jgi:hypothetical protein
MLQITTIRQRYAPHYQPLCNADIFNEIYPNTRHKFVEGWKAQGQVEIEA